MGILADIFISDKTEAMQYQASQLSDYNEHLKKYKPAELRNLTNLEFSTLWGILAKEEWDIDKHDLELIEFAEDGESWLFRFPNEFSNLLSNLNTVSSLQAAEEWAKTEELEMSGWSSAEAQDVILKLTNSSKEALSKNLGLFLSGSV